jgi:hypothetical protein
MIESTGLPESKFSTSCFSGVYPVPVAAAQEVLG